MISNHSQGSSGFLLGWADEGVRPYVVRAAACVGAGALTCPAERSSATSFRDCCRAALGLDGRDARPSMGIACPRADGGVRRYVVCGSNCVGAAGPPPPPRAASPRPRSRAQFPPAAAPPHLRTHQTPAPNL